MRNRVPYKLRYRKGSFFEEIQFPSENEAFRYAEVLALNPAVHTMSIEGPGLAISDGMLRERFANASRSRMGGHEAPG